MASLEDFVGYMEKSEEIGKLAGQREKDSRPQKREEADKKIRGYAYETLKDIHPETYAALTAETLSGENVNEGINLTVGKLRDDSAQKLESNFDEIVNALPAESLEKIALEKTIIAKAEKDYGEMLEHYQQYFSIKQLVERYNAGKVHNPEELQILRSGGAKKVKEEMEKKMKEKGYSKDLQERAGNLASIAAKEGLIKEEYVKEGAKKLVEDAEKKFRDYENQKGKKILDYVKESLGKLAKGKTEEFETAKIIIYRTAKGKFEEEK